MADTTLLELIPNRCPKDTAKLCLIPQLGMIKSRSFRKKTKRQLLITNNHRALSLQLFSGLDALKGFGSFMANKAWKWRGLVFTSVLLIGSTRGFADLNTGLLAYYPFNGNANDASGHNYHGTAYGVSFELGKAGLCGRFSGVQNGSYIDTPAIPIGGSLTMACWAYIDAASIGHQTQIIEDSNSIAIEVATSGTVAWIIPGIGVFTPSGAVAPKQWVHLCAIYDQSILAAKVFVNGTARVTNQITSNISGSRVFRIADDPDFTGQALAGLIDELRIYNRALSATEVQQLYAVGSSPPAILIQPQDVLVSTLGLPASLAVTASGTGPVYYQWWKDGAKLSGKTAATLSVGSLTGADLGYYQVVITNAVGSVTSRTARIVMPHDPLNGTSPVQLDAGVAPTPNPNEDSLVIVTHGWRPLVVVDSVSFVGWVRTMTAAISNRIAMTGQLNWKVMGYEWASGLYSSYTASPDEALNYGYCRGLLLGAKIRTEAWSHIHLIGHSAGSAVIQGVADALVGSGKSVHTTFLDPYLGITTFGRAALGDHADWSDNYFAKDFTGLFTEGKLPHCYNVDVTWLDPFKSTQPKLCEIPNANPAGTSMYQCGFSAAQSDHGWPHDYYLDSITNASSSYPQYGFARSKEAGGWPASLSYLSDNDPVVLGDMSGSFVAPQITVNTASLDLPSLTKATNGNVTITSIGLSLVTASPAWISMGLIVTNQANAVQFDAYFNSANQAEGLLSVYWDTNEIGIVDERVAGSTTQSYTMPLPSVELGGAYLLAFRLDPFGSNNSSMMITNVRTAWITTQPPSLSMNTDPNTHLPMLTVAGFPRAAYLVESSTNLVNWETLGVFSSTNATMRYTDPSSVTNRQRYYRASPW